MKEHFVLFFASSRQQNNWELGSGCQHLTFAKTCCTFIELYSLSYREFFYRKIKSVIWLTHSHKFVAYILAIYINETFWNIGYMSIYMVCVTLWQDWPGQSSMQSILLSKVSVEQTIDSCLISTALYSVICHTPVAHSIMVCF